MPLPNRTVSTEKLLDILDDFPETQVALQQGLRFLVKTAQCQGGVIFILNKKPEVGIVWLSETVPPEWEAGIQDDDSPLIQAALEMSGTGNPIVAQPAFGLIGGLPLVVHHEILGGLLLYDPAANPLVLDELKPLMRILALVIARNPSSFANRDSVNFAFCELVESTQNIYLGLQEIQQRVCAGIQRLVDPDALNLYYYYPEKNNLAEKIEHNLDSGRTEQSFINLAPSLLEKTIVEKKILSFFDLDTSMLYNPEIDGSLEIEPSMALFMPMIANGDAIGAVGMLFKHPPVISPYQQAMLNTIVTALGFAIINTRHIQQLRIVNADVEANRWEIMRSRNILRALFDSLPSSIYIIDQTSRIVAANVSRAKRVGTHPMQLVGKKCYEALYNRNETCPGCLVNETLFAGSNTIRHSRVWLDEQPSDWEISTFVVLNDQNQPGQAIIIEQDVTEKRRLETNLIQSEKLAAVGQLAAGVVHEINNPLAAIIANAQILAQDLAGDEDKLESVKLIELAGMRASQVVKNLLGFARKEQYDFEPVDLNTTIEKAIQLLQHKLIAQSVPLKQDLSDDLPTIMASRDHLEGVWVNLMMNALDAMREQDGRLSISSRYVNNEFRVTVTDNGMGIPPERISHIFEPFYTTKGFNQGTGLGLSICHRVIKNHGGYITVDSQIGEGTKFTVVLPRNTNRSSQTKSQGS
jgi:signal transduction histidine kinase